MIPWILIAVGSVMILAGKRGENPVSILTAVLQGRPIPNSGNKTPAAGTVTPIPDVNNPQPTTPGSTKVAR